MSEEFSFVQNVEVTPYIDNVDQVLKCLLSRWTTDDEVDYSVNQRVYGSGPVEAEEWYGNVSFTLNIAVHYIIQSNFCASSSKPQHP